MARRRAAFIVGVLMLTMALPTAMGNHFSVGGRDSIGTEPTESPSDPSVGAENHATGTSQNCHEASGEVSQEEAEAAMASDPFCGGLAYHADNVDLRHESSPDQDLRSTSQLTVGTFDVIATNVVDVDFFWCQPFCSNQPGGDVAWNAVHTVGQEAGLTDGPQETDEQHGGADGGVIPADGYKRSYGQGVSLHFPTATHVAQENTDAWEMNGWWSPAYMFKNFVAYVYDGQGNPISDQDLQQLVGTEKNPGPLKDSGELPSTAKPIVCGWTPDFQFTSLNFEGSTCEIKFEYREPGTGDADFKAEEDYDDPCESPTWVCGAFSGAAWYSRGWYPTGGTFQATGPDDGTFEYLRWHFFVAGHPSDCGGAQEPGYAFQTDSAENPYLAHEVDVYTKPTDLQGTDDAQSAANLQDFAWEGVDSQLSSLPGVPDNPVDDPTALYPTQVHKDSQTEPNADPVGSLGDTSQSLASDTDLQRTLDSACEELLSDEDTSTVDPWVDLIDGEVHTEDQQVATGFGAYGNDDPNQDDENEPGPNLFRTDGNVGMFTDKNDDGDYDTLSGNPTVLSTRSHISLTSDKYDVNNIQNTGAYPMLWDMWVKDDGSGNLVIDENSGCAGIADRPFAAEMEDAGYGAETALFQAVYLSEPTTFQYSDTGEAVPYPGGENIYLLLSQSARQHYAPDELNANDVDTQIDTAISQLRSTVAPSDANVEIPGDVFGLESDYMTQCSEDTGGFTLEFSFAHQCEAGCSGDTIVTGYTFEVTRSSGALGGGQAVPMFEPGGSAYDFGTGQHTWFDVDPFDGNPDRQDGTDDSPPSAD